MITGFLWAEYSATPKNIVDEYPAPFFYAGKSTFKINGIASLVGIDECEVVGCPNAGSDFVLNFLRAQFFL